MQSGIMKIRFISMLERKVAELTIVFLDYRSWPDSERQGKGVEQQSGCNCTGVPVKIDEDDTVCLGHAFSIVCETVGIPGAGWGQVNLEVAGCTGLAEENLKAGAAPEIVGPFFVFVLGPDDLVSC